MGKTFFFRRRKNTKVKSRMKFLVVALLLVSVKGWICYNGLSSCSNDNTVNIHRCRACGYCRRGHELRGLRLGSIPEGKERNAGFIKLVTADTSCPECVNDPNDTWRCLTCSYHNPIRLERC